MEFSTSSFSALQTRQLGKQIGEILRGGDVVTLIGDLGAGKTAFAQGVGEGLKVKQTMTSPTFTLMHEYSAEAESTPVRLIHMDLYRLRHPEEAEVIGVADSFQKDTICLIEWPEIAEDFLPEDILEIEIKGNGEMTRSIMFRSLSDVWAERFNSIFNKGV